MQDKTPIIKFYARATTVDYTTGKLYRTRKWRSNSIAENEINEIITESPLKYKQNVKVSKLSGDYIRFKHSEMITDYGQDAVPYFDIQEVAPSPPVPLIGAGLYWKSTTKSGGYVGLLVMPNDFRQFINEMDINNLDSMILENEKAWRVAIKLSV